MPFDATWDCEQLCIWMEAETIAHEIIEACHINNLDAQDLLELEEDELMSWVSVGRRRGSVIGPNSAIHELLFKIHGNSSPIARPASTLHDLEEYGETHPEEPDEDDPLASIPDYDLEWGTLDLVDWMDRMGLDQFIEIVDEHELDATDLFHLELSEMVDLFGVDDENTETLEMIEDLYSLIHEEDDKAAPETAQESSPESERPSSFSFSAQMRQPPAHAESWREKIAASWDNAQLITWVSENGVADTSRIEDQHADGADVMELNLDELAHILCDPDQETTDKIFAALRNHQRQAFQAEWSTDDITLWMGEIGESQWTTAVLNNEFDGADMLAMTMPELKAEFGPSAPKLKQAMRWTPSA